MEARFCLHIGVCRFPFFISPSYPLFLPIVSPCSLSLSFFLSLPCLSNVGVQCPVVHFEDSPRNSVTWLKNVIDIFRSSSKWRVELAYSKQRLGYGLDDRGHVIRFSSAAKVCPRLNRQGLFWGPQPPTQWAPRFFLPGVKQPGVKLTTLLHLVSSWTISRGGGGGG